MHGLAEGGSGHASRLLAAIASYDMADNYAYFTDVADSVELAGP